MAAREDRLPSLLNDRVSTRAGSMQRLRQIFLIAQVALTVVLLYLAGVATHSFANAATFNYGFDAERVLLFTPPQWARSGATAKESIADFDRHNEQIRRTVERLTATPGVTAASLIQSAPFGVGDPYDPRPIEPDRPSARIMAQVTYVGVDFVRALGASLVAGQSFDGPEYKNRDDVVLVNETLANQLSPPLGARGSLALAPPVVGRQFRWNGLTLRIIGVVKDLFDGPGAIPAPQFFRPSPVGRFIVIRTDGPIESSLPMVRATLEHQWGSLRTGGLVPMREKLADVLLPLRSDSILLAAIAACCLPIAWIGVMGAVLYSVRVRRREIAVRLALGADPSQVQRVVVLRALAIVGVGLLFGIGLGILAQSIVGHLFFQVRAADPVTMTAVAGGMATLAWLAAAVPAREASSVDPSVALREG